MHARATQAYLELPADDRLETRLPRRLKQDAEAVAKARGESLSEYVTTLLAERVAQEIVTAQEWKLTPAEQVELLRILSAPPPVTPALKTARKRAAALFGSQRPR
jgi:uncharacterized protein (DUF1778 family)